MCSLAQGSTVMQKKLFLFVGLPGSGKTTICRTIAHKYPMVVHQSMGDLLRLEAQQDTPQGKLVHELVTNGKLVTPDITLSILEQFLVHNQQPIILLDGYQGNSDYFEPFQQLLERHAITLVRVISVDVSPDIACMRAGWRKRIDDAPEAFKQRLQNRLKNREAVAHYYGHKGLFTAIDGEQPLANVIAATEYVLELATATAQEHATQPVI